MASIVEIKAATPSVTCDDSGAAEHVINVHNTSGQRLRIGVRVHVEEPTEEKWIGQAFDPKEKDETEWDIDPDETLQLTVPINATGAEPGTYTFRVEVYSTDAPSEDHTIGDGIAFEVKAEIPEPEEKEPGKFPWWIVIVVAVLVIAGIAGGIIYYFVSTTSVPDVIGKPRAEAVEMIESASLVVGAETREMSEEPANSVLDQDPLEGRVKKGTTVDLVLAEAAAPFRVSSVTLSASQRSYRGVCPVTIQFRGQITTEGTPPGTVSYQFARSDGASAPSQQLDFDTVGTKTVGTSWRLNRSLRGWQQLVVTSPNRVESTRAGFQVTCLTNADQFIGNWTNVDANTRGITRTQISRSGSNLVVHMWGSCTPTDCDWGTVSTPVTDADDQVLKIRWDQGFAIRTQQLTLGSDGRLRVDTFVRYTDNSGRADRRTTEYFRKR